MRDMYTPIGLGMSVPVGVTGPSNQTVMALALGGAALILFAAPGGWKLLAVPLAGWGLLVNKIGRAHV